MTKHINCPYQQEVAADIAVLVPPDATTILDVGCGDGFVSRRLPSWCRVIGIDLSLESLRRGEGPRSVGTITGLPFRDASFDLVMVNDVLEHLGCNDRALALQELARVARKYVIITVPLLEDLNAGATRCGSCRRFYHVNGHVDSFGLSEQRHLLDSQDFHCSTQVVSGDVWAFQPQTIMYVRRLFGLQFAPVDEPRCPMCGARGVAAPREPSDWGRVLDSVTCILGLEDENAMQSHSLRTESIGLYEKGRGISAVLPSGFLDEDRRPVSLPAEHISATAVYFDQPDVYRVSAFSTVGSVPYFLADDVDEKGVKLEGGQAAWAGFFVNLSKDTPVQIEIQGEAEAGAILRAWAYDTFRAYHSPVSDPVRGKFCVRLTLPAAELSCFGLLFQLDVEGAPIVLHSMRLVNAQAREIVRYDNRQGKARYFHLPGDSQVLLSLPFYGQTIPDFSWMHVVGALEKCPRAILWPRGLVLPIGGIWQVCRILLTSRPIVRRFMERSMGRRLAWTKDRVRRLLRHSSCRGQGKKSG